MEATEDVVIVGAGISGLATALGLYRKGIRCLILESSESLRSSGFALTIWANAWRALEALGVAEPLRQTHLRLQRLVAFSASSGVTTAQLPFSTQGKQRELEVRCLKRSLLLEALAKELPQGTIKYSSKLVSIEEDGYLKLLHLADGSTLRTKVLLGCDGLNSKVAKWLGLCKPSFSGRLAVRGFADFPHGHDLKPEFFQLAGEGYRGGMLPCDDKCVYWFFNWTPTDKEKEAQKDASKMMDLVLNKTRTSKYPEKKFNQVVERSEASGLVCTPLRYRWPFELLWRDISKGNVSVAGDSLHPMTPDVGQGGCSALEDAVVLSRCLGEALPAGGGRTTGEDEYFGRIKQGLERYAKERRWRSFELIAVSYLTGYIQQGHGVVMSFLRDVCFPVILARILLSKTQFDCGEL